MFQFYSAIYKILNIPIFSKPETYNIKPSVSNREFLNVNEITKNIFYYNHSAG